MAIAAAKRYWLPLFLFALGFFFQLVVLPRSFPPFSELDPPVTTELVKVYSLGSPRCAQFIGAWKMIGTRFTSTHAKFIVTGGRHKVLAVLDS
ncbi:hypothetical protein BHE74_00029187 [Ensete ventricosum]|nr:hypothetical protein GW17_00012183 [Ensete ventricosum]RWW63615.1 hypothetical protein BHE74_00029187 [Ensete ventricosum]RZS03959.1 hypothetical protein BHM03_00034229 [Ensete ventricosum]